MILCARLELLLSVCIQGHHTGASRGMSLYRSKNRTAVSILFAACPFSPGIVKAQPVYINSNPLLLTDGKFCRGLLSAKSLPLGYHQFRSFPRRSIIPTIMLSPLTDGAECKMPAPVSAGMAAHVDELLMGPDYGFSLECLMELAGLSVAEFVVDVTRHSTGKRVGLMCGPGNNGGDGLVCARHLWQFGYRDIHVVYPSKKGKRFDSLVTQLRTLEDIKIYESMDLARDVDVDVWVDCIFGFSFDPHRGAVRQPYAAMIQRMNEHSGMIVAVDIPSGWHVEQGIDSNNGCYLRVPDALISLTAPKMCVECPTIKEMRNKGEQWMHYIGGRFVPSQLAKQLGFEVPQYKGVRQIVRVE